MPLHSSATAFFLAAAGASGRAHADAWAVELESAGCAGAAWVENVAQLLGIAVYKFFARG